MSSHARSSYSHKSKNPRGHDGDSGGVNLTPCNLLKPQSSRTLSVLARQSRKPSLSSDCNELQKPTLQRTLMKFSVQPEKKTDDKYENDVDDDLRSSSQKPSQPANHSLEENPFEENEDASIQDYQYDHQPSRCDTSLKEKRIDLEMLKDKNQNLELLHAIKYACTFSDLEE